MELPLFFLEQLVEVGQSILLPDETTRHITGVLRLKEASELQLTDGKGSLFLAVLTESHKKSCKVQILRKQYFQRETRLITIAISLLKNPNRFEWFLEKATEVGIHNIIPLICSRTEKQSFRYERMKSILVSAMLQSQQVWLPELHNPVDFKELFQTNEIHFTEQKFIAHCERGAKTNLEDAVNGSLSSQVILIGPEGDFTNEEILLTKEHHFIPVALGKTRLRSETAGIVAATILKFSS